jgi:hypothetical protein
MAVDQMPNVPVPQLLLSMFEYDLHGYLGRLIGAVGVLPKAPAIIALDVVEAMGYSLEDDNEIVALLAGETPDPGEHHGDPARMCVPHDPELSAVLRLLEDDVRFETLHRLVQFIGICAPDFEWSKAETEEMIYIVLSSLSYSLVQMRAIGTKEFDNLVRSILEFDWRENHRDANSD